MALELVKLDSETLPAIADAIRGKTGETALLLPSEMAAAIAGIPTGGSLPALTTPAAEKDVLAGKEYIDGSGAKKAGTLVVCDTVQEVEHFGIAGTGVHLDIESTADASSKTLTLPEPNLKSENIKNGVSIFGIAGSAAGGAATINGKAFDCGTFTLASIQENDYTVNHNLGVVPSAAFVWVVNPDYSKRCTLGKFRTDGASEINCVSITAVNGGISPASGGSGAAYRLAWTESTIRVGCSSIYPLLPNITYQWLVIA